MANALVERLERIEARLDELERAFEQIAGLKSTMRLVAHELDGLTRLHSPTHHPEGVVDALRPLLEGLRSDVRETLHATQSVLRKESLLTTNFDRLQTDVDAIGAAVTTIKPQITEVVEAIRSGATAEQLGALADKLEGSADDLTAIETNLKSINPSEPGGAVDNTDGSADVGTGDGGEPPA